MHLFILDVVLCAADLPCSTSIISIEAGDTVENIAQSTIYTPHKNQERELAASLSSPTFI
jgi:hypothetical protein